MQGTIDSEKAKIDESLIDLKDDYVIPPSNNPGHSN
jgi:hypothetical protein